MFRLFMSLAIVLFLLLDLQVASACSPKPWSYEELAQESIAIIHGEVLSSTNNERKPTVKVIHYVGPGTAPKIVHLPSTESSRKTKQDECPDVSMKFRQGESYIFFLKKIGSSPEFLHSDRETALVEEDAYAIVSMHKDKVETEELIQQYASNHQRPVQIPDQAAPEWGSGKKSIILAASVSIAGIVIIGGGIYFFVRRRM
ncbi:hypothetical protein [Paenibacillus sp. 598K]|uniref:hypothetical protein n=1 Tax=Paenibacillus sp. 598K TaxID=1117987 RepID=UPI000FFE3EF8|nr:hypothetical protein [Paenibacillus sp. 598K]